MREKLKAFGTYSLGTLAVFGVLAVTILFSVVMLKGALWLSEKALPVLILFAEVAVIVDILILIPLSLSRRLRAHTGGLIFMSFYLFGLVTWFYAFVITYALWGGVAVFVGLAMFGVGVMFMAILASLLNAMWEPLFTVLVLAILTYGSRVVGYSLANTPPHIQDVDVPV